MIVENWFFGARNISFLDIMSLFHFVFAIGVGLLIIFLFKNTFKKIYFILGLILLAIWEIFEVFLRSIDIYYYNLRNSLSFLPTDWFSYESPINIMGDIIIGFLGILIIYLIFRKYGRFSN